MKKQWSKYQLAIFEHIENSTKSLIINAVAGSGKTTTIVEAMSRIEDKDCIFLAFNKSIAEELKKRNCNASTFHGLCYTAVKEHTKVPSVNSYKIDDILKKVLVPSERELVSPIKRVIGLLKQDCIDSLNSNLTMEVARIVDHHDLDIVTTLDDLSLRVQTIYRLADESKEFDFDDMLYYHWKYKLSFKKRYDVVFVDESQDTNRLQIELLKKLLKKNGKIVAVGDRKQAIYGFRGADSTAMDNIKNIFNADELPLSVSYRCGTNIINLAQRYNPIIQARDDAQAGAIESNVSFDTIQPLSKDLVLCRTTAPLVAQALKFLNQRLPFRMLGRDFGKGIENLFKKITKQCESMEEVYQAIQVWRDREVQKVYDKPDKVESIIDKADSLNLLCGGCKSKEEVFEAIQAVFNDSDKGIILATIHKSKGLEADNVYWLNYSQCPAKWAKKEWQKEQEINLCYVATTRAKNKLVLVG